MAAPSMHHSAFCPGVAGQGYMCMICGDDHATGHIGVTGGPHDGRCLALVCALHASPEGRDAIINRLVEWVDAGLLSLPDLGPGADGAPEVWHGNHLDPLPEHRH